MVYTEIPRLIPTGIRGIILDYGGTLDSHGDHWSHVILDGYRRAGISIDTGTFKEAYIHGERELAKPGRVDPADTFLDLMRKKIRAEMELIDLTDKVRAAEAVAMYCYEQARQSTAEAAVMLADLSRTYPLALVSNFYGNLNAVIADFALDGYFKAVVESATAGVRKPDPAIFRLGIDALGLIPEEVLVIGDSPSKDIAPARALGCRTLLIEGRQWPPQE